MPVPLLARQNAGIMGHKRYRERASRTCFTVLSNPHSVDHIHRLVNTGAIGQHWRHWSILAPLVYTGNVACGGMFGASGDRPRPLSHQETGNCEPQGRRPFHIVFHVLRASPARCHCSTAISPCDNSRGVAALPYPCGTSSVQFVGDVLVVAHGVLVPLASPHGEGLLDMLLGKTAAVPQ